MLHRREPSELRMIGRKAVFRDCRESDHYSRRIALLQFAQQPTPTICLCGRADPLDLRLLYFVICFASFL
jgi:hypothetical protein